MICYVQMIWYNLKRAPAWYVLKRGSAWSVVNRRPDDLSRTDYLIYPNHYPNQRTWYDLKRGSAWAGLKRGSTRSVVKEGLICTQKSIWYILERASSLTVLERWPAWSVLKRGSMICPICENIYLRFRRTSPPRGQTKWDGEHHNCRHQCTHNAPKGVPASTTTACHYHGNASIQTGDLAMHLKKHKKKHDQMTEYIILITIEP